MVTSPACWRCSTRTLWSWPTRQRCGWDPTRSSPALQSVAETFAGRARAARPALIDGAPGAAWLYKGDLSVAFAFTIVGGRITEIELLADPDTLTEARVRLG